MAIPNSNATEIIATTLRWRAPELADNVSKNVALLNRLSEKGNIQTIPGGRTIFRPLEYAENSNFQWYSGYETLNTSASDVITAAEFDWKQCAVAVMLSGLEEAQNSGKWALLSLLKSRISNAEKTMRNNISTGIYSDGTGSAGKTIGGLQQLVPDDPTTSTTIGGINQNTWTFWRSIKYAGVADGGAAVSVVNIQTYMNRLWVQLVRNTEHPDLILADNTYYRYFWESLQAIQRIGPSESKLGKLGFETLKYLNADVVLDGGYGGACPSAHMYFLNTDYIHWNPHSDRNMVPLNPDRYAINQDAKVQLIGFMGNLTASNRKLQGVLIA